ncbi:MAG: signal peptide peptidase SppA [archaeon]
MKKLFLAVFFGLIALVLLALILSFAFSSAFPGLTGEIAVIPIKGEITASNTAFSSSMTSTQIAEKIKEADKDPLIKAIFLDIDSGGGSVVATKEIVYSVRTAKKPVVAFIGETGASGAYYVAAASDLIVADDDSLTGSIGVISVSANIEGLLEKLGIKMNVIKEGQFKDMGSSFRELTPEEQKLLSDLISEVSVNFKKDVLEFRKNKISETTFNSVADGRIISGRQAKQFGLIDFTGSRDFALQKTAELAGISGEPSLKYFDETSNDFFSAVSRMGYSFGTGFISAIKNSEAGFTLSAK